MLGPVFYSDQFQTFLKYEKRSKKIRPKRTQFAGHCFRRTNEQTSKFITLKPNQEKPLKGRPSKIFDDVPENDTRLETPQIEKKSPRSQ